VSAAGGGSLRPDESVGSRGPARLGGEASALRDSGEGAASAAASCVRPLMPSLPYARPRCTSTVVSVTNNVSAIWRLLNPCAARSTTRRSDGVRESTLARATRCGRAPAITSSSWTCSSRPVAPTRRARSRARAQRVPGLYAVSRPPERGAQFCQHLRLREPHGRARGAVRRAAQLHDSLVAADH
jgi:hypothetical protein